MSDSGRTLGDSVNEMYERMLAVRDQELQAAAAAIHDLLEEKGEVVYEVCYLLPDGTPRLWDDFPYPTEKQAREAAARIDVDDRYAYTIVIRRVIRLEVFRCSLGPATSTEDDEDEN